MEIKITLQELVHKIQVIQDFLDAPEYARELQSELHAVKYIVGSDMFNAAMQVISEENK